MRALIATLTTLSLSSLKGHPMLIQAVSKARFEKWLRFALWAFLLSCGQVDFASSQTLSDVKKMAPYIANLNELTAQVSLIFEETSRYDDLANGIFENDIKKPYAVRQARKLSASLLRKLLKIKQKYRSIPPPPTGITSEKLQRSLSIVQKLLTEMIETTELEILEGEKLVDATIFGDPSVQTSIQLRALTRYLGIIDRQAGLIELQMANLKHGSVNNQFYGSILSGYKAVGFSIESIININNADESEHKSLFEISKDQIQVYLDNGFRYIRKGRIETKNILIKLKKLRRKTKNDAENIKLIILAIKTYPDSFDIEEDILSTVEGYLNNLYSNYFQLDNKSIDEFQLKMGILEQRRSKLIINRQKMLGGLR